jgi:hypothetical protein
VTAQFVCSTEVATVSLTGSFSTMPLADVLGWIGTTNRLGILTVHGGGSETMLRLAHGRIVECETSDPPALLGQFLMFHGLIDEEILYRAMRAHAEQDRRLGEVLLDMGAVGADDLNQALTAKAEETVLRSFDTSSRWFTFDPSLASLEAPQQLDMSIGDAIARGGTRVENAAAAALRLKRSGTVLCKTAKAPSAKLSTVWPLRNAYALVDGERSIDEIVLHMHGIEFQVIQRLYQLFVEGFIEVLERPETATSHDLAVANDDLTFAAADPPRPEMMEGVIPIALPSEIVQESGNLSIVEKYLLTLCDGTRDVQRIAAVAPVQAHVVMRTIQSLQTRGWLQALPPLSDH